MLDEESKKNLGKILKSEVISEFGDTLTIEVTFEGGTCTYECNRKTGKTKGHKYEYTRSDN